MRSKDAWMIVTYTVLVYFLGFIFGALAAFVVMYP